MLHLVKLLALSLLSLLNTDALVFKPLISKKFRYQTIHSLSNNENFESIPVSYESKLKSQARSVMIGSLLSIFTVQVTAAKAGFFEPDEQSKINELCNYQKPIGELVDQLKPSDIPNAIGVYAPTQVLKGGKEDSDVVLNYLEAYIKPCQRMMEQLAPKLQLSSPDDQTKLETLPLLMKGHIIELTQAIGEMSAKSQLREVTEVQETLADYLKLAGSKFTITTYAPARPLSDAELFGPLGCEFWGKKRVPGSNACQ